MPNSKFPLHLHNTQSRNIFPIDMEGCVLYAPLWQEDMQGSSLISYDQYRHVCTVTSPTWDIQGRIFDGTDDKIVSAVGSATFLNASTALTIIAWAKWNSGVALGAAKAVLNIGTKPTTNNILTLGAGWTANLASFWINDSGGTWRTAGDGTTNIRTLGWCQLVGVMNGTTLQIWVNAVLENSATVGTGILNTLADCAFHIGVDDSAAGVQAQWNGSIGEALVYNRALSAAEIMHNYLVTKWRYV